MIKDLRIWIRGFLLRPFDCYNRVVMSVLLTDSVSVTVTVMGSLGGVSTPGQVWTKRAVTVARVASGHSLPPVDRLQCSVNQAPCGLVSATALCRAPRAPWIR